MIDLSISLDTRPLLSLFFLLSASSLSHRPTLLTRHSQVVWGDRQKGGEGRDLEGKGEDNMYLKRTKEGV